MPAPDDSASLLPPGLQSTPLRPYSTVNVNYGPFYDEYHGHPVDDLEKVVAAIRGQGKSIIWLAGDSSLDNKYWFSATSNAVNGYEAVLSPPRMKQDVSYWLNVFAMERTGHGEDSPPLACVNTAIEATSLNDRACTKLLAQDELIRRNIQPQDYLIISVGGNDVALQPLLCTVCTQGC
jgi:hypothetical protein